MEIAWYLQLNSGTSKKKKIDLKNDKKKRISLWRFENNLSEKNKKKAKTHFLEL